MTKSTQKPKSKRKTGRDHLKAGTRARYTFRLADDTGKDLLDHHKYGYKSQGRMIDGCVRYCVDNKISNSTKKKIE